VGRPRDLRPGDAVVTPGLAEVVLAFHGESESKRSVLLAPNPNAEPAVCCSPTPERIAPASWWCEHVVGVVERSRGIRVSRLARCCSGIGRDDLRTPGAVSGD